MSRVFILGAGATAGYSVQQPEIPPPVARNFLSASVSLCRANRLHREDFDAVWEFVERHYRISFDQLVTGQLDIEELLTLADLSGNATMRRQLIRLIILTLDSILYGYECPHHRRLLDSLQPQDAIITFNWDLILDNIAQRHCSGPDYGAPCLHVSGRRLNGTRSPLILKLHGSFNWMSCPRCKRYNAVLGAGKIVARNEENGGTACPECRRAMQPIMIYPTLFKKYDSSVCREVWERARCILRGARDITIIGYSLPPTDFAAKWLFMQTAAERQQPLERFTIIDLEPTRLRDRFTAAFQAPAENVNLVTGGIANALDP